MNKASGSCFIEPDGVDLNLQSKMVRDTGFEPVGVACKFKASSATDSPDYSLPQGSAPELVELCDAWTDLPLPLKAAVLAIIRSHKGSNS